MDFEQEDLLYYKNNTNLNSDVIRFRLKMYKDLENSLDQRNNTIDIVLFIFVYTLLALLVI